jgi:hypothetical protein
MPIPIIADTLAAIPGIRHGFFGRQGGVSSGHYASLNCGLGSGDRREAVVENRARVAAALGVPAMPVLTLYQVHSATVVVVDKPVRREDLPKADALVTQERGIVIGAMAADCAPVLFADPETCMIAAAHAGWRGAFGGVLEATITTMTRLGARREDIRAAIGPTINQPAYEVGPELEAQFLAAAPGNERYFTRQSPGARPQFDLPGYIEGRLRTAGLGPIERRTPCTYANESLFFSYRRATHRKEPDYGRQISAIVVT